MRKILLLPLFFCLNTFSQEIVKELMINPILFENKRTHIESKFIITPPFIDDFSYLSVHPDTILWQDNSVFINRNYGINPITIGVATFDGLNSFGRPYDMGSTGNNSENADTLTSQRIDLSNIDSAYFLFYYQPQGLGNDPQLSDSLILEFSYGNDTLGDIIWKTIWKKEGSSYYDFQKFIYIFTDPQYLTNEFYFRFRNLASVTGNFDHWNIDYVKLDEYNNPLDTSNLNDVSFIRNTPNLLSRYKEMPWIHFVNDVIPEMNDSIDVILRNNTLINQSIDYRYDVYKNDNLVFHYPVLGGVNSTRNVDVPPYINSGLYSFNSPPVMISDQIFPVSSSDSAEFIFRNSINTPPNDFKMNDTVFHTQRFYSHFCYDDGSAESAYGINSQGAKIAYEFKLNRPDSIRMIQIKFVEMQDDLEDNNFVLTIWKNNNGVPGQVAYKDTVEIEYGNRGDFTNYYLKNGVGLVGTFFVGWEQTTNDILNLGFDKNSLANNFMFYNIGSGWVNSQFPGSWMIRPVVNYDYPLVSSLSNNSSNINVEIYPNPFTQMTSIYFENSQRRQINVYDLMGRNIRSVFTSDIKLDLHKEYLNRGIYFVQIIEGNMTEIKKIIIN